MIVQHPTLDQCSQWLAWQWQVFTHSSWCDHRTAL